MKNNRQKKNWLVDALLLASFLIAFMLDLTGLTLHQWLGVAVGVLAGYHLVVHWTWVKSVSERLFGNTSRQANRYFLVDADLYLGFLLISVTGLVISTWFDLSLENFQAWKDLHIIVSLLTLLLVVVKIAIHSRWIVSVAKTHIFRSESSAHENRSFPSTPLKPAPVKVAADRRDFLKLMGIVGVGALLAGFSALDGLNESVGNEAGSDQSSSVLVASAQDDAQAQSIGGASSDSCSVGCDRGCSYPGHCRRYTDSNQNDLCDFGECL